MIRHSRIRRCYNRPVVFGMEGHVLRVRARACQGGRATRVPPSLLRGRVAVLLLEQLQVPGKKAMPVQDILNSRASWFEVGTQLT